MVQYDLMHVALVAVAGASLTVGLRTGSLAPIFPTVTRAKAPGKFWLGIGCYSLFVIVFFVGLIFVLLGWVS